MKSNLLTSRHTLTFSSAHLSNVDLTTSFGLQISFNGRVASPTLIDMASGDRFPLEDCSDNLIVSCSRYMDVLDAIVTAHALEKSLLLFVKRVQHRTTKYGSVNDRDLANICNRFHRRNL